MDLHDAFGSAFVFSRLGTGGTENPGDDEKKQPRVEAEEEVKNMKKETVSRPKRRALPEVPEVYVLNLQIGRDDCHLLCMFLLVFTISFILSRK